MAVCPVLLACAIGLKRKVFVPLGHNFAIVFELAN
jgi:hypothetical protein